jgi:hypothetical protein
MATSATAARLGQEIADGGGTSSRWLALAVVVAGGLVEGVVLGLLQGQVLGARWPQLRRARFVGFTVLVAGIGWAAASAPSVLAGDQNTGAGPPVVLVVLGGVGLGAVMGPVLGAAQVIPLRGVVVHPWRWIAANAASWPVAMAVIFAGASTAEGSWSTFALAAYGAATGLLAGTALGIVSGGWLDSLDGQPVGNRLALALLADRRFGLHERLVGVAVTVRRTGRVVRFPVQYVLVNEDLLVVPGHAERKRWWRNLRDPGTTVGVLYDGRWVLAEAEIVEAGDAGYEAALSAYHHRWPRSEPSVWDPVVVLHGVSRGIPASSRGLESVR